MSLLALEYKRIQSSDSASSILRFFLELCPREEMSGVAAGRCVDSVLGLNKREEKKNRFATFAGGEAIHCDAIDMVSRDQVQYKLNNNNGF